MTGSDSYVLACNRPWVSDVFFRRRATLSGNWLLVADHKDLKLEFLHALSPRYIFFPHWSHLVPDEIWKSFECVCFHMTDLPYGRGGSPLQNLIARGHSETVLTALQMTGELDAGPVYEKRPLKLHGSAKQIYERATELTFDSMSWIAAEHPVPQPQTGTVTEFSRRTADQSRLPETPNLEALYDHIRMLDAPGYPKAFLDHDDLRIHFTEADLVDDTLFARVRIEKNGR